MTEEPSSLVLHPSSIDAGTRLDAYLASHVDGWSRSRLRQLVADEDVLVNGRPAKPSYKVRENDEIDVELTELAAAAFEPEDIPLDIVFEDEYLAVINKPAGMVVHPGAGVQSGTLANAIAHHFSLIPHASPLAPRLGIVHRLDKDTSGLIVVAKTDEVHEALSQQFHDRKVEKHYVALVHGHVEQPSGKIEAPIARNKHNRLRMKVGTSGRTALSLWRVRQRFDKFTLLDVEIKTGRTHQIRVHAAYINHPIVGDEIYNEGRDNTVADVSVRNAIRSLGRFFLHAERLSFTHPKTGERLSYSKEIPEDLKQFLTRL